MPPEIIMFISSRATLIPLMNIIIILLASREQTKMSHTLNLNLVKSRATNVSTFFFFEGINNKLSFKLKKDISLHQSDQLTHLIGTWVGDIDDTSSQLCLQVIDKGSLQSLSLVEDIVLISSTRQSQEKTEVTVPLQRRQRFVLLAD